ncbi:MAG TPA: c-type cytochrome [Gemmatimonadaceae bacterium]|nr:c-type cytochrome [Gemmatimonadaceae bacterium]
MLIKSFTLLAAGICLSGCKSERPTAPPSDVPAVDSRGPLNPALIASGKTIFRFDTYGDETFWTDTLRMHEVIRTSVSPTTALSVGLKVDVDALPSAVITALQNKTIDLNDPATTVTLLKLGAVLGVIGHVDASNTLTGVGITCAFCHSTVDNSFATGIGHRLDGWPNRDLNVGGIIALSPALTAAQRTVYQSWGPGKYDPRFNIDGKNIPAVIPPAFGLRDVKREIYTGDDTISYWNAYVAITQMHGHGHFSDPRIGVDVNNPPDLVSPKLAALRTYQFSLESPAPIAGTFDADAARRGRAVFNSVAQCASCHVGSAYTDVNQGILHTPAEDGQDPVYALRSATKLYRTTPLRGLWHPPQLRGPYFHDGHAGTLAAVVDHYVQLRGLSLTSQQRADLIEYLKSL